MAWNKLINFSSAALIAALAIPAASFGQSGWSGADWDSDGTAGLSRDEFSSGFAESGTFNAWDRDRDAGLSERELGSGMFSRWDADNDLEISEEEYGMGSQRWYGADHGRPFSDYDADASGSVDRAEFGGAWDNEYFPGWDTDGDSLLNEDEFATGVYDTADSSLSQDEVISVEEEGWFEGWFDGDDVEAEIQEVGDVF